MSLREVKFQINELVFTILRNLVHNMLLYKNIWRNIGEGTLY